MRFLLAWTFVFAVAAYDSYFAWCNRSTMAEWEGNPLACWCVVRWGLTPVLAAKGLGLVFACLVVALALRRGRSWVATALTAVTAAAHACLAAIYLLGL